MNATTKKKPRHTVPNGIYPATLQDYQLVNTKNGMRYQFIFSLDGMKTKDGMPVTLMRTTSPSMAHKSHRREIVEALQRSEFEGVKDLFGNPAADKESLPAELINTLQNEDAAKAAADAALEGAITGEVGKSPATHKSDRGDHMKKYGEGHTNDAHPDYWKKDGEKSDDKKKDEKDKDNNF